MNTAFLTTQYMPMVENSLSAANEVTLTPAIKNHGKIEKMSKLKKKNL
jgi:hypothetical protein